MIAYICNHSDFQQLEHAPHILTCAKIMKNFPAVCFSPPMAEKILSLKAKMILVKPYLEPSGSASGSTATEVSSSGFFSPRFRYLFALSSPEDISLWASVL